MKILPIALGATLVCVSAALQSQPAFPDTDEEVRVIASRPAVARALTIAQELDAVSENELIELTEIPAPPFGEQARARRYADLLLAAGLTDVGIDEIGNVVARRPGHGDGDTVALAAHLDTVFPFETDVTVRRRGNRLYAPGVGDDTRGLVLVLNVARALIQADVRTAGDVVFVGTVGEEGVGDLRGARHLFGNEGPGIGQFIAVDGGDDSRVVNQAIGSRRYRVTVTGPGGHSWGDFGLVNPAHALGRAMYYFDEAATVLVNDGVPTSYNVGRIGGGTAVNAVPQETWAEVDLRSVDPAQLDRLEDTLFSAVERALVDQNRRRDRGPALESQLTLIGDRPSGSVDASTALVQRALAVTRHLGLSPRFGAGSTDANVPIARGVPAVTIGRGGTGGGAHSLSEWWAPSLPNVAVQRALLLLVTSAGVVD
ncbi:uncharacterized protein METZ01_LOCUS29389 [marine metagenome]|uniref:Peptidase M20 dimerisation domain-containing protein n=1 Tax=marine metagenome TaxID=408172 RepID=A0A381QB29_9ZZZZ